MRVFFFLICALFSFLSSYPSFALDEEDGAEMLFGLSEYSGGQRLRKREDPHKELRKEVQRAVGEIMSIGGAKDTGSIIGTLEKKVSGLEEFLQRDKGRKTVRQWVYGAQDRYFKDLKEHAVQETTEALSAYSRNIEDNVDQSSPYPFHSLFSTVTQAMGPLDLDNNLPSLYELFPDDAFQPMPSSAVPILPPISFLESNNDFSWDDSPIILPPLLSWDALGSPHEK